MPLKVLAPLERQGVREKGVDFVAKNVWEMMLFMSFYTASPHTYQESQHVKGFEKSFSKETYLNLFNLVFPKHI